MKCEMCSVKMSENEMKINIYNEKISISEWKWNMKQRNGDIMKYENNQCGEANTKHEISENKIKMTKIENDHEIYERISGGEIKQAWKSNNKANMKKKWNGKIIEAEEKWSRKRNENIRSKWKWK